MLHLTLPHISSDTGCELGMEKLSKPFSTFASAIVNVLSHQSRHLRVLRSRSLDKPLLGETRGEINEFPNSMQTEIAVKRELSSLK